jgi:hypothetical protein
MTWRSLLLSFAVVLTASAAWAAVDPPIFIWLDHDETLNKINIWVDPPVDPVTGYEMAGGQFVVGVDVFHNGSWRSAVYAAAFAQPLANRKISISCGPGSSVPVEKGDLVYVRALYVSNTGAISEYTYSTIKSTAEDPLDTLVAIGWICALCACFLVAQGTWHNFQRSSAKDNLL